MELLFAKLSLADNIRETVLNNLLPDGQTHTNVMKRGQNRCHNMLINVL